MAQNKQAAGKKIKILTVSHSGEIGGAELALLDMLDYLCTTTPIEPHFILPWDEGGLDAQLKKRGWEYTVVNYGLWSWVKLPTHAEDVYRESLRNITAIEGIAKAIDAVRPDIVWSNSVVCPWGAVAAGMRGVPHIWYVHEYGDVGLNLTFELGRDQSLHDVGFLSDLVIANSLTIKDHLSNYVDPGKVHTAYIPYDAARIEKLSTEKNADVFSGTADVNLVIVGRIVKTKGQLDAVNAVALLKQRGIRAELCIVGTAMHDRPYEAEIKQVIKTHQMADQIIFVEHTSNPFPYIAAADVGLTCSHHEAFGRTTFEYMLLGKAVVASTDTGATKELVRDGRNGLGYEFGKAEDLANHIEIYAKDKSLITRHGVESKKVSEEILHGPNSAEHLGKLIEHLHTQPHTQKLPFITSKLVGFGSVVQAYSKVAIVSPRRITNNKALRRIYHSKPFRPAKKVIKSLRERRR